MLHRSRTCPVAPWRVDPSRSSLTVWEASGSKVYTLAPELVGLRRLYNEILGAAGLHCKPHLVFVEDAYGAGGFAYGNLLVIGRKDQEEMGAVLQRDFPGLMITPRPDRERTAA